jgi:hypothetical protein
LGLEFAHRLFDRRGFRPALGEINNFDDAGLVAFDRAFGIQKPKRTDNRQHDDEKFPGAHFQPKNRHPERKSRDPEEVTLKLAQRDSSTSLGMTG